MVHRPAASVAHLFLVAACGGPKHAAAPAAPEDPLTIKHEHWEDIEDRRFVFVETCGMGPFELTLPARTEGVEYGRRIALVIYGARMLELDARVDSSVQTGIAFGGHETASEHADCRIGESVPIGATPGKGTPAQPRVPVTPRGRHADRALDTPSEELPVLEPFDGELPGEPRQAGAFAFYPKGKPFYYADEYWSSPIEASAGEPIRIRFWTASPSKLRGVVFRLLEQRLVPDLPEPRYATDFAMRVARVKQKLEEDRPALRAKQKQDEAFCKAFPEDSACVERRRVRMRIPPAPLAETRPKPPSADAQWIPGAWSWDEAVGDFTWVGGTFVIRPKQVVAATPAPPAPAPEPPREIDAAVTEQPVAKAEVIRPPPPPTAPTVWIPGHWQLVGASWVWVPGRWEVAGDLRFRAPAVRTRGAVRIYVPGGWIRVR